MRSAIRAIGALALLGYLLGQLGEYAWPLDLFTHFRVQYGWILFSSAVLLSFMRDVRFALPLWLAAAWLIAPIAQDVVHAATTPRLDAVTQPTFKVVTLNAWYRNPDTARIARYLTKTQADVILIQELDGARIRDLSAALPTYGHVAFTDSMGRYGAAILSRWPIAKMQALQLHDTRRHAQWALIEWHSTPVQVVAAHLPWPLGPHVAEARDRQLQSLAQWLGTAAGPAIAGGDFNVSPWSPHFAKALTTAHIQDALAGYPAMSTWPTQFPPLGIQIDHCLISPQWQVIRTTRGPSVGSDHYPVEVELRLLTTSVAG